MRCDVIVFDPGVGGTRVSSGIDPALSPDGKRIMFAAATRPDVFAPTDLIVVNLEDGTRTKVTDRGLTPAWSADGQQIAFVTTTSTGTFERVMVVGGERERGPVGVAIRARPALFLLGLMYTKLIKEFVRVEVLLTEAQIDAWLVRNAPSGSSRRP